MGCCHTSDATAGGRRRLDEGGEANDGHGQLDASVNMMDLEDEGYILSHLETHCDANTWATMTMGIVSMTSRSKNVKILLAARKLRGTNSQPEPQHEIQEALDLSLIHISEPTRLLSISYAVFCLKKKKKNHCLTNPI
eukprot:TRINITY_DN2577_c0_g1_i3.p1 TRINITY_DN2577_c0_g1~~TRINITY_DN2577_c0_g1_i3.p1  ORF type:complete len:138 (+),score=35.52 TRINITY_DN2577_c0_g1_i3:37-450(+)